MFKKYIKLMLKMQMKKLNSKLNNLNFKFLKDIK